MRIRLTICTIAAAFALASQSVAAAQDCPPDPLAEIETPEAEMPFAIGDTTGLNVVSRRYQVQAMLAEGACLPDWRAGELHVTVGYPARAAVPGDAPSDVVSNDLADWRVLSVEALSIAGGQGQERVGQARDPETDALFVFYDLSITYPDNGVLRIVTRAPIARREEIVSRMRTLAASVTRRTGAEDGGREMRAALDDFFMRVRAPFVRQAIDACVGGEITLNAAMARATEAGWPAFTTTQRAGADWRMSAAPSNDSAPIRLLMHHDDTAFRCMITSNHAVLPAFSQEFARIPGEGETRVVILDGGQMTALANGSTRTSRGAHLVEARLRHEEGRGAAITLVVTPMWTR